MEGNAALFVIAAPIANLLMQNGARAQEAPTNGKPGSRGQRANATRALVQLIAEGIACDLYVRSFNSREHSATYELVISNNTAAGISCRLYGIDRSANTREFGMLTIGKYSAGNSFFSIPNETGNDGRLFVEVVGDGVNLFAEALQPAARTKVQWPRAVIGGLLVALSLALGAVYVSEKPSIEGLSVATSTAPGRVVAVYAIGGRARSQYRATLSDGLVLAKGASSASSGKIVMRVPVWAVGQVVHLALEAGGPFGNAERTMDFTVVDDPIAAIATIVKRGSGLPAVTDTNVSATDVFSIPERVLAGATFKVLIKQPVPALKITFKDDLDAIVDEVVVPANASSITLLAPASTVARTYTVSGTFMRGMSEERLERSVRANLH